MDSDKIDELLGKYWNCQTTLEEEKQLREYFRTTPVPEAMKETAAMFGYFEAKHSQTLNDASFDAGLQKKLRKPAAQLTSLIYNSMRIAAGIIVLVLAVWLVRIEVRKSAPDEFADTYNDPDKAFQETKRALMMISKSFSTAEEQVKKINLFNEAQEEIRTEGTSPEL